MRILRLDLFDVRHFHSKHLKFNPGFNLLVGENGAGKSTVLRSILTVLGKAENFRHSDHLSDDDIRHGVTELRVKLTFSSEQKEGQLELARRWQGKVKRTGRAPEIPVFWFGPSESIAAPLRSQKPHRYVSKVKDDSGFRNELLLREDFLYQEMLSERSDESISAEFGRSETVRRFVGRILSEFSPKFRKFAWRFLPYDCSVNFPELQGMKSKEKRQLSRQVQAEIMRDFAREGYWLRHQGWGSRRKITYNAKGLPLEGEKSIPIMRAFPEIFQRVGTRLKADTKQIESATVELRLCPRITVAGQEGPLLLSQLSEGEKRLFSMIVDIARQLSRKSDGWDNIEKAPGIVVIDEIDCHLHPKWQRMIVKALEDLFKGCQIIATTHSPFIIQAVGYEQLQSLSQQPLDDFTDRSIEEIVVKVMRIEDSEVSLKYLELLDVAKRYYGLLERAKVANGGERDRLKQRMKELSSKYVRNPAFQAFLELKQTATIGSDVSQ